VNIPGTSATLSAVAGVAVDAAGNAFFSSGNFVLRLDATTGILTLAAGNGQLSGPTGVGVKTGVKLDHWGGEKVDHSVGS